MPVEMKDKYPKACADFKEWAIASDKIGDWINWFEWDDMPFEMQLGVYLKYFSEHNQHSHQGIMHTWEEAIEQAFKIREQELTNKQK